jgi:hypothetical protein
MKNNAFIVEKRPNQTKKNEPNKKTKKYQYQLFRKKTA